MVITLTDDMTKEEFQKKLAEMKPTKIFDSTKYCGKVKYDEEPLEFQKRMRNEWDREVSS